MAASLHGTEFIVSSQPISIAEVQAIGAHTPIRTLIFADTPIGDAHVRELRGLVNLSRLSMHGSKITDAALQDLAALPKLKHLDIARSNITGAGLVHFKGHPSLNSLSLEETNVTDQTLPLAADIPKLEGLDLRETQTTIVGLMPLAKLKRLSVWRSEYMTPKEFQQFQTQQRLLARPAGRRKTAPATLAPIEQVFKSFLGEMAALERHACDAMPPMSDQIALQQFLEQVRSADADIFARHCTPDAASEGRYSYSSRTWSNQQIGEIDLVSKGKAYVYTLGTGEWEEQQYRFTMLLTPQGWRVHAKVRKAAGWKTDVF